ncbi:flagellar biosynthetic protein FliR [Paraglaciecola chathamensis]|jgi:flagellar biosynthetic protein FliR|uniref:Flagellar biosynthetic protein FliR n=3 Tax=Paraglaciecola chathamensis TaxID=368405 RepID=A0ABS0WBR2_9ALTE|nr:MULTISPECIES: flagellar biosynthetic protein FliR [Paraglaciecola]AEE22254.1 flagellar biosynthetic protein FliR [Glaciecola sp. 4H-3-7+YE-5]MBN27969.1 flagellar type III secretion system protein FliR [Alteromonadaceae bacterium]MBJ2135917.1 flagellar type III secretion system protein FliR [Paraglaciecola chathamensis]MBU3017252.1 flagellar type III secretion system protein FliR [Paraglaciecola agarilytica]MDO6558220.1 flagellar biosynthetic protein FliR [Paraglaciecola chathamensis]|tara:strand:+ start:26992 stop:27771 length:780 start_codon:yes stop_codon:yes gene_type:complete
MEFSADVITQFMGDMLLPFMRISGMLATMVGLSAKTVPTTVRALLTLFITLIILPVIPPVQVDEVFSVGTFMLVIQQLIIGISLGFISTMVLNTFVLAGQVVAMQTGLGFASIVDPVNGINVPAVGQFYLILATLLFWALDGHLAMIRMVVMSFTAFPVGEAWLQPEQFREIAHWAGWMFISAVTLSLAPIVSLLIVNLAFGVMTKAAPQLNIFSLGFSIAQIMGLVIIWITMDNFTYHFEVQWDRAQQMMCQLVRVCP